MTTTGDASRPHSWAELMEALYEGDWDEALRRHRSPFAYRGMTDASWGMPTSLIRMGGNPAALEKHLLRNFRKYAHRDVVERESYWYWLSIAQHHGLPTRLMDWTYSPLVALHFATDKLARMDVDGIVWCVDIPRAHALLPGPLLDVLGEEGSYVFTVDMLTRFSYPGIVETSSGGRENSSIPVKDLDDFGNLAPETFGLFMEPPSIDDRIVNQFALFSVLSDPSVSTHEWLERHPELVKRIVVSAELKWEVRDRLDQANISERVLFPGLDGLSDWLKRHYCPRA